MLNRGSRIDSLTTIDVGAHSDVDDLVAIERAAFASDRIGRAEFEQLLRSPEVAVLRASYGNVSVGAVVLKRVDAKVGCDAYLYSLGVIPEFLRRGIGHALLARADAVAAQWQASRMLLEVRPDNSGAIAFYEDAGFFAIGRRPGWYEDGAPALCMARLLPWTSSSNHPTDEAHA